MARKRLEGSALATYDDVDVALRKIASIDRDLAMIEAAENAGIDAIKQGSRERAEPIVAVRAALEAQIKQFCIEHKADFEKVRSRELVFGTVGFRRSSKLKLAKDTLQRLRDLGLRNFIRTKETVKKDELKKATDEVLAQVGARRTGKDEPYYETKAEQSATADLQRAA
jgi:phage host-nuclease inhibitor protein Gam